jgi:hypothetical protein
MNRDEILEQIKVFKARRIKTRLANYGTTVSLFLGLSIFADGLTLSSLYSFLIFLPVIIYFFSQSLKFAKKSRKLKLRLKELELSHYLLRPSFSLFKFVGQPNLAFRLSLALLFLILFTTLARLSTTNPTLTYETRFATTNYYK